MQPPSQIEVKIGRTVSNVLRYEETELKLLDFIGHPWFSERLDVRLKPTLSGRI